ncbi:MAG: permease-like cell division protein FtsX [Bacteroidales bacterium]|nr:permease-like cell division protein FtsX [Bacteroidales bacterium]MCF8332747.1 permease-like cell division protein FtsX [Bacteroidales bacterium]
MAKSEDKYYKRRLKNSYFTTQVSITLVLFVLGLLGMFLMHAQKITELVRENIGFTITLNQDVEETDIIRFQKKMEVNDYVRSTKYISKEDAARTLKKDLGEDFIGFLGYNPLSPQVEVKLKASYAKSDSLKLIERQLMRNSNIKEVDYQETMITKINDNIERISYILLGISILLLFVAIALINNTIRLAVYSRRFLIRTMQLVGATQAFIRRPFIKQGVLHGLLGAIIAILLLAALVYFGETNLPELRALRNLEHYSILAGGILLSGILISYFSTFFAVRKFLNVNNDKLYQ